MAGTVSRATGARSCVQDSLASSLCAVFSCPVVSDSLRPHGLCVVYQASLSMGILQARILEWVAMPSSWDLTKPGIEPRSPSLQVDSLPSESPGKPKITGMGSLSPLQGSSQPRGSNQGLLHCRQIL